MRSEPEQRVRSIVSELAALDSEGLTEGDRVGLVAALESLKGSAAATQARLTASAVEDREALGESTRSVRADLALARRCSPTRADQHVGVARALVHEMPHTMAALTAGELSEHRASIVVRETACLSLEDRVEADARLAPVLATLGDRALASAARRVGAALDNDALARRERRAVASRFVSVRPAADGMAWLSVLGPMKEVVGAHAALVAEEKRRYTIDPSLPKDEWEREASRLRSDERGKGAWIADRALELLSGRAPGEPQQVAVNLVMTDRAMLPAAFGGLAPDDDCAVVPGWGPVSGNEARQSIGAVLDGTTIESDDHRPSDRFVWVRRLFTDPSGRDLVSLDSVRRKFHGGLRAFLDLRDPVCRVPWCDAPAVEADHALSVSRGGRTSAGNGAGLCQRHNLVKEESGWQFLVTSTGLERQGPHELRITTPTGRRLDAAAPPILGDGWTPTPVRAVAGPHAPPTRVPVDPLPDRTDHCVDQRTELRGHRGDVPHVFDTGDPPLGPFADEWMPDEPPPLPEDPRASSWRHDDVPDEAWWLDDAFGEAAVA